MELSSRSSVGVRREIGTKKKRDDDDEYAGPHSRVEGNVGHRRASRVDDKAARMWDADHGGLAYGGDAHAKLAHRCVRDAMIAGAWEAPGRDPMSRSRDPIPILTGRYRAGDDSSSREEEDDSESAASMSDDSDGGELPIHVLEKAAMYGRELARGLRAKDLQVRTSWSKAVGIEVRVAFQEQVAVHAFQREAEMLLKGGHSARKRVRRK